MTLVGATVLSSVFGGLKETLSHCTELSLSPIFKLLCPPATRMQQIICSSTVVITVCLLYFQPEWPSPPAPTSFLPLLLAPPPPPSPSHPQHSISHSTNPTQALLPQQPRPNGICKPWLFDQQKIHSIQRETKKTTNPSKYWCESNKNKNATKEDDFCFFTPADYPKKTLDSITSIFQVRQRHSHWMCFLPTSLGFPYSPVQFFMDEYIPPPPPSIAACFWRSVNPNCTCISMFKPIWWRDILSKCLAYFNTTWRRFFSCLYFIFMLMCLWVCKKESLLSKNVVVSRITPNHVVMNAGFPTYSICSVGSVAVVSAAPSRTVQQPRPQTR